MKTLCGLLFTGLILCPIAGAEAKQTPKRILVVKIVKQSRPSYGSWEGGTYLPSERGNPLSSPKKFWDYNDRWQSGGSSQ